MGFPCRMNKKKNLSTHKRNKQKEILAIIFLVLSRQIQAEILRNFVTLKDKTTFC